MRNWIFLFLFIPTISFAQSQTQLQIAPPSPSFNDYFELGLSGNYRKVNLSTDNNASQRAYDEYSSYTASFAYYFREMTALELSYSEGKNTRFIPSPSITSTTTHKYSLIGLDLIFTFGQRTDQFIPYIKAGIAYFDKKSIDYDYIYNGISQTPQTVDLNSSIVPSAGVGIQTRITQRLALKTGIEVWTSGPIDKDIKNFDWAARIGFSWFI